MARSGNTDVEFNEDFFANVLRSPKVEALTDKAGEAVLDKARNTAPVDTEAYRNGLHLEHKESGYRRVTQVVGSDGKTLLIESKLGVLARATKATKLS